MHTNKIKRAIRKLILDALNLFWKNSITLNKKFVNFSNFRKLYSMKYFSEKITLENK